MGGGGVGEGLGVGLAAATVTTPTSFLALELRPLCVRAASVIDFSYPFYLLQSVYSLSFTFLAAIMSLCQPRPTGLLGRHRHHVQEAPPPAERHPQVSTSAGATSVYRQPKHKSYFTTRIDMNT